MALQDVSATINADRPENGLEGLAQVRMCIQEKTYMYMYMHHPLYETYCVYVHVQCTLILY